MMHLIRDVLTVDNLFRSDVTSQQVNFYNSTGEAYATSEADWCSSGCDAIAAFRPENVSNTQVRR